MNYCELKHEKTDNHIERNGILFKVKDRDFKLNIGLVSIDRISIKNIILKIMNSKKSNF